MTQQRHPITPNIVDELSSDMDVSFEAPRAVIGLRPVQLLDVVTLAEAWEGINAGQHGTVVDLLDEHHVLVEFVAANGATQALVPLPVNVLRSGQRVGLLRGHFEVPDPDPVVDAELAALFLSQDADSGHEGVDDEWRALVERGLRCKLQLLHSTEFNSTKEVSELLAIDVPAVRKQIVEKKLFALKAPSEAEYYIPTWATDSEVMGRITVVLLEEVSRYSADEWRLYQFFTTPHGALNGLQPFQCLLSPERLPPTVRRKREELTTYLGLSSLASLLDKVRQALREELEQDCSGFS